MASYRWLLSLPGLALLALAGCSKPGPATPANRLAYNDFEAVAGWGPVPTSLTSERAHSGRYCVKVDASNEYGLGYNCPLPASSLPAGGQLRVRGWALRSGPQGAGAAVVVEVIDPAQPSKPVVWDALLVRKQVITYNRWVPIHQTFAMPATLPAGCFLKVYLWRNGDTQPTYLDDLELLGD